MERTIERAAHRLGISYSRAWAYWYGKVRNVPADEYLNVKARADARRRERIVELQAEIARLQAPADLLQEGADRRPAGGE
jgi:hypothetical protein